MGLFLCMLYTSLGVVVLTRRVPVGQRITKMVCGLILTPSGLVGSAKNLPCCANWTLGATSAAGHALQVQCLWLLCSAWPMLYGPGPRPSLSLGCSQCMTDHGPESYEAAATKQQLAWGALVVLGHILQLYVAAGVVRVVEVVEGSICFTCITLCVPSGLSVCWDVHVSKASHAV